VWGDAFVAAGAWDPALKAGDMRGIDVWAHNNVSAGGVVVAGRGMATETGNIEARNGNVEARYDVRAGGDVRAQTVHANGGVHAGTVHSQGDMTVGGNVQVSEGIEAARGITGDYFRTTTEATAGQVCAPRGAVATDSKEVLMTCRPDGNGKNRWAAIGGFKGDYVDLSTQSDGFSRTNNTGGTIIVAAHGGKVGGPNNACYLAGVVEGQVIQFDYDNNPSYSKRCSITFPVGPGQQWRVVAQPWVDGYGQVPGGTFDLSYYH